MKPWKQKQNLKQKWKRKKINRFRHSEQDRTHSTMFDPCPEATKSYMHKIHFARAHFKGPSDFMPWSENALETIQKVLHKMIQGFVLNALYAGTALQADALERGFTVLNNEFT